MQAAAVSLDGRADMRSSEWTNRPSKPTLRARFIHIQMRALYDRANESANALAHTRIYGLEITARVEARRYLAVDLFVTPRGRLFRLRCAVSRS